MTVLVSHAYYLKNHLCLWFFKKNWTAWYKQPPSNDFSHIWEDVFWWWYLYCVVFTHFRAFPHGETNSRVSLCSAWEKSHYSSYFLTYPLQLNYLQECTENESVPVIISVHVCVCVCSFFLWITLLLLVFQDNNPFSTSVCHIKYELRSQKTLDSRSDWAIHWELGTDGVWKCA